MNRWYYYGIAVCGGDSDVADQRFIENCVDGGTVVIPSFGDSPNPGPF
jgi:hypothetical protein